MRGLLCLLYGLLVSSLLAGCVHPSSDQGPPKSLSSTDIRSARVIALIGLDKAFFFPEQETDILHSEVDEGYRYTQVESFGPVQTRSVFSANGTFTYAIQEALPDKPSSNFLSGSGFGAEEISRERFESIANAFSAIDICNATSDSFDPDNLPNDGGTWSYEAVKDGQYCFAWFTMPPKENMIAPAAAFEALFKKAERLDP